ncbi:MAG: class II aldolase [Mesorhizobium sp.]|uniref:class II aldolase/adducin family protein n=1 Tax=unclassified Mesorhizobium TaxID=325217 RepID=UPI000F74EB1B|nr:MULTISPECIES: class II aldolase/adducin family protein [unclassified Mesorhizobium]AZO48610.1 class II aldolase [Mesorhizobium sp. M4B.F.Ca.ET.058.02.1.1]RVC43534.1 class II aldolase [Mesorhizobium sp. M4A.F.Ca.ET.090.04.2.1]RWC49712.1 MAG: class II aldolase [Mesorhizobium sp.]RWD04485.1 MAG: class II aldolase [Mesorhizobium sp.]RWD15789.1 MAG: class II aldolase [Mesorhizobium sp.]
MAERNDHDAAELQALRVLSASVGADPLLVQGAGGNTSLKQAGVLWIKASGTWLMNAASNDIMVPVALAPLLDAVARNDPAAEKAAVFTLAELNPHQLRPSIETTVHALLPQKVVVHVHCVETIAIAVQANAEALLEERLRGLDWAFVPYRRPGLPLAQGIAERLKPGTDVLVLGNHGLVVAAETVTEANLLLRRVTGLLARAPRKVPAPDIDALIRLAMGSAYRLPVAIEAHAAATDLASCRIAASGSLYPDHVIFLGIGSAIAGPNENAAAVVARTTAAGQPAPASILFPGKGILMRRDANAGAEAMARCLADVVIRVDPTARVNYLSIEENAELLNWDAEKYRQELNRRAGSVLQ